MAEAFLGLGSNLGDKHANIHAALRHLTRAGDIQILRTSRLYRTAPWGDVDQDWFLNACVAVGTDLPPLDLLGRCLDAEAAVGRVRDDARRWGPRVVDIDLLLYGNVSLDDPRLTLPHPRILERAFVLIPLADIAPDVQVGEVRIADAARGIASDGIEVWGSVRDIPSPPPG
jgi:2-amino-4-hydroxy-6-hydroxymethyldihydropteridine diphosphokinase